MIALVIGKNRGYFEIEKSYEGKPYKSRFIQIEQVQENGEIPPVFSYYQCNHFLLPLFIINFII